MTWAYGEPVLYRYGRFGQPTFVRMGRVISDDDIGLAIWVPPGSPQVVTRLADGRALRDVTVAERARLPRTRSVTTWQGQGIVQLLPPGDDCSIWWFFDQDGAFDCWYGNLEAAGVRWEHDGLRGVDSADRALDVIVEKDRSATWKDEDDFAALTGVPGFWSEAQAPGIRTTGERLMAAAAAGDPPFDGRWTRYRPDPGWPPLTLPDGWDRPHEAGP